MHAAEQKHGRSAVPGVKQDAACERARALQVSVRGWPQCTCSHSHASGMRGLRQKAMQSWMGAWTGMIAQQKHEWQALLANNSSAGAPWLRLRTAGGAARVHCLSQEALPRCGRDRHRAARAPTGDGTDKIPRLA